MLEVIPVQLIQIGSHYLIDLCLLAESVDVYNRNKQQNK
jgi:hypothetical protein